MLFPFYEHLRDLFGPLNILRYVPFRVIAAVVTALIITWGLFPWFIRRLKERSVGQTIREELPEHAHKGGTPTMGGALMIIAILASVLLWGDLSNMYVVLTCAIVIAFGAVGFADDWLKLSRGGGKGLRGKTKLLWQFGTAFAVLAFFFYVVAPGTDYNFRMYFPYLRIDRFYLELPDWAYLIFGAIVVVGTSNAVNLADGLDGLAIFPTITASAVYLILAYVGGATLFGWSLAKYLFVPEIAGIAEMAVIAAAMIGAGFGFLWFNSAPASIYMGDVGALSLGGALGCLALFTKNEWLSVIILGIFVMEVASDIIQTTSFKLTGKRVFKKAPIHHHFQMLGYPEGKIVARFWIVSMLLGLIALASIKLR